MDQNIEETVNKDTHTPSGARGFSTKKGALAKFYLNVDYRASYIRYLKQVTNVEINSMKHSDMKLPVELGEMKNMLGITNMLCNFCQNPFERSGMDLCSILTGGTLSADVVADILNTEKTRIET